MNHTQPQPAPAAAPSQPASSSPPSWQGELKNYLNVTSTLSMVWILLSGVLALVFLLYFVVDLFRFGFANDLFGFLYWGIAALVSLFIHGESRGWTNLADSGQYGVLRERILLWAILGLIFGVLLGLLLIVIYLRLDGVGGSFLWSTPPPHKR